MSNQKASFVDPVFDVHILYVHGTVSTQVIDLLPVFHNTLGVGDFFFLILEMGASNDAMSIYITDCKLLDQNQNKAHAWARFESGQVDANAQLCY